MSQPPLLPQVADGMRQMPPFDAFATALELTASLFASTSFSGRANSSKTGKTYTNLLAIFELTANQAAILITSSLPGPRAEQYPAPALPNRIAAGGWEAF